MVANRHHLKTPLCIVLLIAFLLATRPFSFALNIDSTSTFRMIATFYADKFHGRKTSSGEIFDQNKATAAHISIKLGTWVRVTNTRNNEQIIVKINDRCPKRGVIDLSRSAAKKIGIRGTAPVIVEILSADSAANLLAQCQLEEKKETDSHDTGSSPFNETDNKRIGSTTAASPQQQTEKNPSKTPPNKEDKTHSNNTIDKTRYNILLCTVTSQHKALQEVEKLPILYQGNVRINPNASHSKHLVMLDLSMSKHQAEEICKLLQKTFPNCKPIQISH